MTCFPSSCSPVFAAYLCCACRVKAHLVTGALWVACKPPGCAQHGLQFLTGFSIFFPLYLCTWSLKNTLEAVINQLQRCTKARLSPDAYQTFSLWSNVRLESRHNSPHIPRLHALGKWKGCWQFVFVSAALLRDSTIYIPEELVVSLLRRGPTLFVDPRSPPSGPMRSSHVGASSVTAVHCLPPPSSTRVPSSTAR